MAGDWQRLLRYYLVAPLVASRNRSLALRARKDLLGEALDPPLLWNEDPVVKLIRKQMPDGRWRYPLANPKIRSGEDYDQIETFRCLGELVEKHGVTCAHPSIGRACPFLLSHQTLDGDIRGILGRQYAPYYTAAMMELIIRCGNQDDPRIEKAFSWLASMRQNDGG